MQVEPVQHETPCDAVAGTDGVSLPLSLPLLHCGPVKHVPHACCLLLEELAVLCALLGPGRVKRCGVLVHQVGVFGASRPTKVFDLVRGNKLER